MRIGPGRLGRWPAGVAVAGLLIVFLCAAVDRPASTWAHAAFGEPGRNEGLKRLFIALTHIVDPIPPLATLGVLVLGIALARAEGSSGKSRLLFATSAATLLSVAVKDQLKYAFGRLWPETWINGNPSWIGNAEYGFHPFHGGIGWSSFPSGHMTVIAAPMSMLMIIAPSWRPLWAVPVVLVGLGLYGADYHFLSDIVAGAVLGALCSRLVFAFMTTAAGAAGAGDG